MQSHGELEPYHMDLGPTEKNQLVRCISWNAKIKIFQTEYLFSGEKFYKSYVIMYQQGGYVLRCVLLGNSIAGKHSTCFHILRYYAITWQYDFMETALYVGSFAVGSVVISDKESIPRL